MEYQFGRLAQVALYYYEILLLEIQQVPFSVMVQAAIYLFQRRLIGQVIQLLEQVV